MPPIATSIFDLFKIGPGPSSSHTIGPMRAGNNFIRLLQNLPPAELASARRLRVLLYGSLSDTGRGHGTDRAVLAGLLGHEPGNCSAQTLDSLDIDRGTQHTVAVRERSLTITPSDIIFTTERRGGRRDRAPHFPYSNTLVIQLMDRTKVLFEREYYSVGGGFIEWKGSTPERRGRPRFPYSNTLQLQEQLRRHRVTLHALMLANEQAITGVPPAQIQKQLDAILDAMIAAVERGMVTEGYLPGPIHLHRKGPLLFQRAQKMAHSPDRFLVDLCAYALAAAEENAAGHPVVTAPTCGSAGVIPAVLYLLHRNNKLPRAVLRDALLAAAVVGFIIKHGASLSGAEVGCQGEIGAASAMAAAFIADAHSQPFMILENAAETALEHHLGMTCDPVKGYVQIPCIERNAMGAVKAYTAYLIACAGIPEWHVVGLDKAVKAMALTGRDMPSQYKETSRGGLARCC
ncbi:MAG: L-serine ammonia-lyase [Verrucomicrobia bacterium]|nr:L-serine ammonia-lyase [Verrucomicrobiota bacterium]MCG2681075.1 L-serine ammonia-lyase [Kiritimatiellia bacterium]MBU4248304.1 L-serine ammonia-lyase [Verrucomicrobiota bacterium]MBU4290498.1 L-serine ammonia-lyase [Verrucomicrobiota bacterium]MBU4427881.1 L-serine ammonia-lyase [Verrucomicrobiota bacterium]